MDWLLVVTFVLAAGTGADGRPQSQVIREPDRPMPTERACNEAARATRTSAPADAVVFARCIEVRK